MGVDVDEAEAYAGRGVIMLEMDPPKHTRYRLLVNKGFTPRMIGLLNQALRTRATHIIDQVDREGRGRLRHRDRVRAPAAGDRRDHGRAAGRPHEAVRVVEQHDRRGRPGVHEREQRQRDGRAVRLRQQPRRDASGRPTRRHRHQAAQRRDRRRQALGARVRHVHAAARGGRQRDHAQRDRARHARAAHEPRAVRLAEGRSRRSHRPRDRGDPPLGVAGAALQAHRHRRHRDPRPGRSRKATRS